MSLLFLFARKSKKEKKPIFAYIIKYSINIYIVSIFIVLLYYYRYTIFIVSYNIVILIVL